MTTDLLAPYLTDELRTAIELLDHNVWNVYPVSGIVTIVRLWTDDSADTIFVLDPDTANGLRDNGFGQQVWQCEGSPLEVVRSILALQAPGQPDAPATPLPGRVKDGT